MIFLESIVTEKKYNIHYYEVDYKKRALITSIMDYLGDIAMAQSEEQGVGISYLNKNNIAWIIYQWNINVHKYPNLFDTVTVKTIPYGFNKFYAYRKYEVFNNKGELLVSADSIWLLIDTEKRKAVRIPDNIYLAYGVDKDCNNIIKGQKIRAKGDAIYEKEFEVRYSDIDTNVHVNNVKYVAWAIETVPKNIVVDYSLKNIIVTYEKETTYGEKIKVLTAIDGEEGNSITYIHKIIDMDDNELTVLKSTWEK